MKIYNKILHYFLGNFWNDKTSINFKKAKALTIFIFAGIAILLPIITYIVILKGITIATVPIIVLLLHAIMLVIIRKGKALIAGNILSVSILFIQILSMFANPNNESIPFFFTQQFYIFFAVILLSAMFASKLILIINTIAIITSTIYVYYINIDLIPENIKDITRVGIIVFETIIIIIFSLSFLFTNFINKAIKDLSEKTKKIEDQNDSMTKIAEKVELSSSELLQASNQLSLFSQEISQSSNEQAATTEEVSGSMHQMISAIKDNTENAVKTYEKSNKTAANLQKSSKVILQTIDLVNQISKKTEIISDIAFQTNVLSLNASIAAAKAGRYGKAFAVVAHEIRNLAEKSKTASAEIEKLSKSGTVISKIARKVLEKSLSEIIENANLINKITNASKEQKKGVVLFNNSIQQLSGITNKNSASAEEMSANAEELASQAEQLKQIITNFNISN